jgi:predicted transcriptional regulator
MAPKQSAQMTEALRLIMEEGKTAYAAAKLAGITQAAISVNKQYREWKEAQNAKPNP